MRRSGSSAPLYSTESEKMAVKVVTYKYQKDDEVEIVKTFDNADDWKIVVYGGGDYQVLTVQVLDRETRKVTAEFKNFSHVESVPSEDEDEDE